MEAETNQGMCFDYTTRRTEQSDHTLFHCSGSELFHYRSQSLGHELVLRHELGFRLLLRRGFIGIYHEWLLLFAYIHLFVEYELVLFG